MHGFDHALRGHGQRNHHPEGHLRHLFHHGRGRRSMRRGNVRVAILAVLADRPMHGYQIIQELEARTGARWKPSAGSVYPTLQMLEDEGLLSSEEVEGRKTYTLTDAGRAVAEENPVAPEGWRDADDADGSPSFQELAGRLIAAAAELDRTGNDEARLTARQALVDARKRIYRLLAEDDETDQPSR